jgi:hypothetical protein
MGAEVAIVAIVGAVVGEVMSNSGNETVAAIGTASEVGSLGVLGAGAAESLTAADAVAATGEAGAVVDTGTTMAANVEVGTFSSSEFGASTSQLGSGVMGMSGGDVSTAYAGTIAGDSVTSSTVIGGATEAGAYGTAADASLSAGSSWSISDAYNAAKQVNQGVSAVRQVSQALAPKVANNASAVGVRTAAQQFTQAAPSYQNGLAALTGAQKKAFNVAEPLTPQQVAASSTPSNGWIMPLMVLAILAFAYKEMPHG